MQGRFYETAPTLALRHVVHVVVLRGRLVRSISIDACTAAPATLEVVQAGKFAMDTWQVLVELRRCASVDNVVRVQNLCICCLVLMNDI